MADPGAWRPETIAQHLGEERTPFGAVAPPIFQNSTFAHKDWDSFAASSPHPEGGPYNYSRLTNPTLEVAERKIAALEGTDCCKVLSSGMAAMTAAILANVRAGSHVVCVDTVYGPTRQFLVDYLPKFGVETTFVVGEDPAEFEAACRPETTLIFLESPSSLVFKLQDLAAVAQIAQSRGIATAIDNTYASPVFQNPARLGIDYVCHTASKYLGGHSDVVAGALCCSRERMDALIRDEVALLGSVASPFVAWCINRSMRTLHLRVKATGAAADRVAAFLKSRPEVEAVIHVGDPDFRQRALRDRQMSGWSGLLTFLPRQNEREWCRRFTESMRLYQMAVSWGGHESLAVGLEAKPMDWPEKRWMVRLYCGLENPEDLVADLEQAFAAAS
jgi:cystathionine beta-lyase/cystathionine gamma-synthase